MRGEREKNLERDAMANRQHHQSQQQSPQQQLPQSQPQYQSQQQEQCQDLEPSQSQSPRQGRRPLLSSGMSWSAIGIVGSLILTIGLPLIYFVIGINRELGKMSTTLDRVATDLSDNQSEHKEFRATITELYISGQDHARSIAEHERRLGEVEAAK